MSLEPRAIPEISSKILVISKNELNRITTQFSKDEQKAKQEAEAREKAELREASKNITNTWKDIPALACKRQLEEIKLKAETLEAERERIDELEGRFQDLRRRYVVDMAQRRLYEETDRVKTLKKAVRLAETLKENEELRKQLNSKHLFDKYDAEYLRCVQADVDKISEEKEEAIKKDKLAKREYASQLKKQQSSVEARKKVYQNNELEMGRMMADLEDQFKEEDSVNRKKDWQNKLDYRSVLDNIMTQKKQLNTVLPEMAKAEEERCRIFLDGKRKMAMKYKEMEKERNKEQERKKLLISNHLKELRGKVDESEALSLAKAIKEKEDQYLEKERSKKEANLRDTTDRVETWGKQINFKKMNKLTELAQNLDQHFKKEDLYERLTAEENKKQLEMEERNKFAEHLLLHQMAMKLADRHEALKDKQKEFDQHMSSLQEEDETFLKYANEVIEECQLRGLDVTPIRKAALPGIECGTGPLLTERGNIRPKYFASPGQKNELCCIERTSKHGGAETKKRLGFTSD